MAMEINRLSAAAVKNQKKRGLYADGNGLYLQVSNYGSKSWTFRFTLNGKARQMGLGAIGEVSLSAARDEAIRCRGLLRDGIDPIAEREARRVRQRIDGAKSKTFRDCAVAYIRSQEPSWKNVKQSNQWANSLDSYAYPVIGDLPVSEIDTALVTQVLEPIWAIKTETASRVRGRIEAILDWATVSGFRAGENPARWRGHLDKLFPKKSRVRKVQHHSSLPYSKISTFMAALDQRTGSAALGLKFTILTAARSGEAIGATWDEIDLAKRIWWIPATRMKAQKEHRVALSECAVDLLKNIQRQGEGGFIFPGHRYKQSLSNMAFSQLLKRMGYGGITTHGFRSTFRDWVSEHTGYSSEVAEMALAHTVSDKVEAAYRRGDLLQKRFNLMDDWAAYCYAPPIDDENVVPLNRQA